MDYSKLLSSGGGGGGGYSGELKNDLKTGGDLKATFGSINFGAGASVGGTSTAEGDAATGLGKQWMVWAAAGVLALILVVVLLKR